MILEILIVVLMSGAILSILFSRLSNSIPRYIALFALAIDLIILLSFWNRVPFPVLFGSKNGWMLESNREWIQIFSANLHLAMDGLSYLMLLLTFFMGFITVMVTSKTDNDGFFYFNTLLMIAGVTGIFLAMDLLLFFFFWELMLVPIYLLMVKFGKDPSSKSSFKLLLYTQASGLVLLISIIILNAIFYHITGWNSFDYFNLYGISMGPNVASILMFGFLFAFLVKLPSLPFHGWFPSSFKNAPVVAITAGLLIKTGAYGIIRFALPIFQEASMLYNYAFLILGVITILYGAFMAFSKDDLRVIAAYIGISHMGFIIVGIFSYNIIAWQGVILQMIMSAIGTSALLLFASLLLKRTGTCNISQLGGLFEKMPILSGMGMFFAFAILGLPGTGNFVAEFLILTGVFKTNILIAVLSSFGLIISVAYSLRIIQKVIVGKKTIESPMEDLKIVEKIVMGCLVVLILWIGLYPKPVMDRSKPAVEKLLNKIVLKNETSQQKEVSTLSK
jgi:NADH-quinone oxidoreductase subunit M